MYFCTFPLLLFSATSLPASPAGAQCIFGSNVDLQEPPGWNNSHKGALGRDMGGRQGVGRGVDQKESLQELKERFMARLQEVGTPVDPKSSTPSQLQCTSDALQDV